MIRKKDLVENFTFEDFRFRYCQNFDLEPKDIQKFKKVSDIRGSAQTIILKILTIKSFLWVRNFDPDFSIGKSYNINLLSIFKMLV